jgi:hypothetical protein
VPPLPEVVVAERDALKIKLQGALELTNWSLVTVGCHWSEYVRVLNLLAEARAVLQAVENPPG